MWPFTRSKPKVEERAAWLPGRGTDGFGGDPFWSWGSLAGVNVSPQTAESVAAVGAAVSAIATTLACLPCAVVEASEARNEVPNHDLTRMIRDGVGNQTWAEFLETLTSSTLLHGNGAASIGTDGRGRLTSLTILPWPQITVRVSDGGALLLDYLPLVPPGAGRRRTYARDDLVWLRDRSDDGLVGVPRLQRAAASMAYAISIQGTAQSFSANLARPGGILSSPTHLGDDVRARLKQDWDNAFGQRAERGKVAVLGGGMTWNPMTAMTAEDAELIEARRFSVEDIGRIFGVPSWLLGDPSRATFASSREASRSFAVLSLQPWARRIEAAFQATVLAPQYRLRFDIDSLIKADPESFYGALLRGRQGGWLSPNDCRAETGWPRSGAPTADSIEPPVAGGRAAGEAPSTDTPPPPSDGEGDKVARLDHRRRS